jgi:ATP-dependent DNA helicase RecG
MEEIKSVLLSLLKNNENEYVEYKEAKNNFDFNELGRYFSALSNGANLLSKQFAWLVFGVHDKTHEFVNTNYRKNSNLNGLKREITQFTNDNMTFLEIYEFEIDGNRVIMFKIPAAIGVPTTWKGIAYDRNDDALIPLNDTKRNTILSTVNIDWSRQIVEGLAVEDLDKNAILKAREQFKKKNENKAIANEIDDMDDLTFLNKAKVLLNGKVTRAAWLLLGNEDTNTYVDSNIPTITWKLQEGTSTIDYEHFTIPFIITMEKASEKIRNLRYRYMPSQTTLFPNEVDKYDINRLRELLNNSIAHQDYRRGGRVNILEMKDKVMIINEGSFIPQTVDTLIINEGYVPPYYRNPFLAQAMVNLNMIDTAGMGIRRSFEKLRERFFPMPDYDLSEENRVKVTIYGKILDEQYSKLLLENTELSLVEVMLLDRVQKNILITKEQSDYLRKNKLIEGRYPNIYVSKSISEIVNEKSTYIKNSGFDDQYYKDLVLQYLEKFKSITKEDLDNLLLNKLPDSLNEEQKKRKIKYLVNECLQSKEKLIKNIGTTRYPVWSRK